MTEIEFDFNQKIIVIQANLGDSFQQVIKNYIIKTSLDPTTIYFFANGAKIDETKTVESQMNEVNKKNNKMKVLVHSIEKSNDVFIQSKEIICPECLNPCRIKIKNSKIKLYDCIKGHKTKNININEFKKTQNINLSQIKCDKCKEKNKGNSFNNEFFICTTCKQNICPLCKLSHDSEHNIIEYNKKNYICHNHGDFYINYCKDCKKNLCFLCQTEHKDHKTVSFENLMKKVDEIKNKLSDMKINIDKFKDKIKEIIEQLNNLVKTIELYYEINNDILKNYKINNKNFETLQNINDISITIKLFEKINDINNNQNFKDILFNIIDIYNKINTNNENIEDNIHNKPITMKITEIILNQMKNSLCKIKTENDEKAVRIGIFTKILYNSEDIPILIINKNIINEKEIQVELYEYNKKVIKKISLDNERRKYINNDLNVSIIEIKKDIDKIDNFIEIDEDIIKYDMKENNEIYDKYENEDIYILNYQNNNDITVSYEIFKKEIIENLKNKYMKLKSDFCLPILLVKNNKLIGIYKKIDDNNINEIISNLIFEFKNKLNTDKENKKFRNKENYIFQ